MNTELRWKAGIAGVAAILLLAAVGQMTAPPVTVNPPPSAQTENPAVAPPPPLKARLGVIAPPNDASPTDDGSQVRVLGRIPEPQRFLSTAIRNGGQLILTRGSRLQPVALISDALVPHAPPEGYRLEVTTARDVTEEVRASLWPVELPMGATRALLIWPAGLQHLVHRTVQQYQGEDSIELEFNVDTAAPDGLCVKVLRIALAGSWSALERPCVHRNPHK